MHFPLVFIVLEKLKKTQLLFNKKQFPKTERQYKKKYFNKIFHQVNQCLYIKRVPKCSELMHSVIFNYWQYWIISWSKVRYPGNSVPKIWQTKAINIITNHRHHQHINHQQTEQGFRKNQQINIICQYNKGTLTSWSSTNHCLGVPTGRGASARH